MFASLELFLTRWCDRKIHHIYCHSVIHCFFIGPNNHFIFLFYQHRCLIIPPPPPPPPPPPNHISLPNSAFVVSALLLDAKNGNVAGMKCVFVVNNAKGQQRNNSNKPKKKRSFHPTKKMTTDAYWLLPICITDCLPCLFIDHTISWRQMIQAPIIPLDNCDIVNFVSRCSPRNQRRRGHQGIDHTLLLPGNSRPRFVWWQIMRKNHYSHEKWYSKGTPQFIIGWQCIAWKHFSWRCFIWSWCK